MGAVASLVQHSIDHDKVQDEVAGALTTLARIGLALLGIAVVAACGGAIASVGAHSDPTATDSRSIWWIVAVSSVVCLAGFSVLAVRTRGYTWGNKTQQWWMLALVGLDVVVAVPLAVGFAIALAFFAIGVAIAALFIVAVILVIIGMFS